MSESLEDALRRSQSEQGLIAAGDRLLVAVSGGPDSLSLLHALHTLKSELGLADLQAAHLDHGLRGEASAADAAFVQTFCDERGIPCHQGQADVAALAHQRKISKQAAARAARYGFLDAAAEPIHANKIATAHTQDDQAETILLNILRGTGLDGLRGIPVRRGRYIRPLLGVSRADVLAYCETHGLTPRLDASNLTTHYTRNRLRLELLPQIERDYNPAVRDALLRLSEIAARDADYLRAQATATLPEVTLASDAACLVLDCAKLRRLHPSLLRHVLRAAFLLSRGTLEGIAHEHLEPLCAAVLGRQRLPFGLTTPAPHCAARVTQRRMTLRLRVDLSF